MENKTEYLGDGLYAVFDGYGIQLRANDRERPTDTVYLEPAVLSALKRFADQCYTQPNQSRTTRRWP